MLASEGSISYEIQDSPVEGALIYKYINYVAPYTELIEELTLQEFLTFHFSFKKIRNSITLSEIISRIKLENEADKQIRYFSSGMKQRLKLGLAFYSETPVLLLDEPTTNLDEENRTWYLEQIRTILPDKIVVIASNQQEEYSFAHQNICIPKYISN